ncbi:MAG TPA: transcriptional regulator [Candidatus Agrococcus pullicola]|uniref:Transcriptional regulator n=1 Tax=Candidatus Agrococcus pullicola TaxID=2838429 RepID=A0A9D2C9Q1_9MICO|nr:transcriptional regulator [Candidatus Agrococcus pullicola]
MPSARSRDMLVRAATLYYMDGRSQAEVATTIGVSRSNVSRMLTDARRLGIVEITIHDAQGRANELEARVRERTGMQDVIVARGTDRNLARVGALGAEWLLDHAPRDGRISVSWGASVQAVVDAVEPGTSMPGLEILPLVGGLSTVDSASDGNVLVRSLATRLGARHRRLYAPAVVESEQLRDGLLSESTIRSVLDDAAGGDLAIVGVGAVGAGASKAIVDSVSLSSSDRQAFERSGVVGDCCTRFYDSQGRQTDTPLDRRVVAIDLENLARIPTVLAVAAGARKAQAVQAGIAGGLYDVLIIDEPLAEALLD